MIRIIILLILAFALVSPLSLAQPGQGGNPGGNPGGGGQGDPCSRPNPPPACSSVPIDGTAFLIIGGVLIVIYLTSRKTAKN